MKKLFFGSLFSIFIGIILIGCNKEQIKPQPTTANEESSNVAFKKGGVVYANLSCKLPNGETGCQCAITQSDDDCSLVTECTAQSTLLNYDTALKNMFTYAEIQKRAINNVRITEPELIVALKLDNFPLK